MSVSKVTINGVELELNLLDADVIEKYENLNDEIMKKIQDPKAYEGKSTAEGMRYQCRCVERFFDALFGEGTSERVFPKNNDLGNRLEAFGETAKLAKSAGTELNTIIDKYAPGRVQNRAERRAAQKKKNKNFHAVNNG